MLTKEMQQSMTARLNRVEGQLRGTGMLLLDLAQRIATEWFDRVVGARIAEICDSHAIASLKRRMPRWKMMRLFPMTSPASRTNPSAADVTNRRLLVLPDDLLTESGPLTDQQWHLLHEHPDSGARMVSVLPDHGEVELTVVSGRNPRVNCDMQSFADLQLEDVIILRRSADSSPARSRSSSTTTSPKTRPAVPPCGCPMAPRCCSRGRRPTTWT